MMLGSGYLGSPVNARTSISVVRQDKMCEVIQVTEPLEVFVTVIMEHCFGVVTHLVQIPRPCSVPKSLQ
ncbi:hypothetical protein J6590_064336 [Homalodisca vitripennis]|nr:hypothetical protein J6590_064336 [Homalodisca vitripennis]